MLAVQATNLTGRCGLLVSMRVRSTDGRRVELHSGPDWRVSAKAKGSWMEPEHNDTAWEMAAVLGKYGDKPWGKPKPEKKPFRSLCMRKEVVLKGEVARARAYVSGLGCYRLSINGQRVSQDVFTPGWTHYDKRVQYQTYDLTRLLREGTNAIGAVLGNGWWSGQLGGSWSGPVGWDRPDSRDQGTLRLIMQLNVEYADGTRERVATDDTWKTHPSPITRDSFYHGETYDARLEMPGWDRPGFDDHEWPPAFVLTDAPLGQLVAQRSETIRITQELEALSVTNPDPGIYVFDFGQNMAGWARLKVRGLRGTKVTLRFAEVLKDDGHIYRDNYRSAQATDEYILKGEGEEVWEPLFTYRGLRYTELCGYPGEPPKDALRACVVHSAVPSAGRFSCSNELLNRLHRNITWGQRSNMHSVPTDCPQRDERLGWLGDAQLFAPTSCWNMDMASFYSKWMRDIADSQGADGHVTNVAPVAVATEPASPGWGDAVVVIPWTVYQFYGDTRIIEKNYDAMRAWVEYMRRHSSDHLYEREGYGDWIAVVASPKKPMAAAYYFYSTKLLSRMAAVIGRNDDAARYAGLADHIAEAFNSKYFDTDANNYLSGTQTANILPLYFGITPEVRQKAVAENIVRDIRRRADHLSTGIHGTAYLMPLLADRGYQELAYRLATQTTYPSWGYMIEHDATTVWELWDSDKKGPEMNSRNHFTLGSVGRWLFETVAGINIDPSQPGFKRAIIRPRPAGDLIWARAEYPSMYGLIRSEWRRDDGRLALEVLIPANTSALVFLPTRGERKISVTEQGTPVLTNGQSDQRMPGVNFLRHERDSAVFEVGSGRYEFGLNTGS